MLQPQRLAYLNRKKLVQLEIPVLVLRVCTSCTFWITLDMDKAFLGHKGEKANHINPVV